MTYDEAMTSNVTAAEAKREVLNHGVLWSDFTKEYGEFEEYEGADVLGWLGY